MSTLRVVLTPEDFEACRSAGRLTVVIDKLALEQQGGVVSRAAEVTYAEVVRASAAHARGLPEKPGARIEFWLSEPKVEEA